MIIGALPVRTCPQILLGRSNQEEWGGRDMEDQGVDGRIGPESDADWIAVEIC
jgi:hypothetical protein